MQTITLAQPWRNILLTVHVAATVGTFGADIVLLMLAAAGLGGANPVTVYPAAHLVGVWLVAPLALVSLGTGLLLGVLTPWGLFRYRWVTIKLVIVLALVVALFASLVPALGAAADAAAGPAPRPLSVGDRLPLVIAPAVAVALLAVALVLGIFKPGRRRGVRAAVEEGDAADAVSPGARHS